MTSTEVVLFGVAAAASFLAGWQRRGHRSALRRRVDRAYWDGYWQAWRDRRDGLDRTHTAVEIMGARYTERIMENEGA